MSRTIRNNRIRISRVFGYWILGNKPEWSFSLWLKQKTKEAVKFLSHFDKLIVNEAKSNKVDGIICGHLHIMKDEVIDGIRYLNSGCWTEFCSYIVEHQDGKIEVVRYD